MPVKAQPPTPTGPHCALHDPAFVVACDYGAAELLLRHLYPEAAAAAGAAASYDLRAGRQLPNRWLKAYVS